MTLFTFQYSRNLDTYIQNTPQVTMVTIDVLANNKEQAEYLIKQLELDEFELDNITES